MTIMDGNTVEISHCHHCKESFQWEKCEERLGVKLKPGHDAPTVCKRCLTIKVIVLECLIELGYLCE